MILAVEAMIKKALKYCAEKSSSSDTKEIAKKIRSNHGGVNSTFRYALAKEICEQLVLNHNEVEACYIFGSSLTDVAKITSDIDLIIKVAQKSKALEDSVVRMDGEILDYYRRNMNGDAKGLRKMLDVYFVDDNDILDGSGFSSVISSTHSPPIKIAEGNGKARRIKS